MLSYNQALDFIHGLNKFGTKLGLHNITKLLELLGNPHKGIKIIHVAGTNGKGSTCAMIDSILRSAGFRVGRLPRRRRRRSNRLLFMSLRYRADCAPADSMSRL